jgi:hypothetical protein
VQQPAGHDVALQTHDEPLQDWPKAQVVQVAPPVPQAELLGISHVPVALQQPEGQEAAEQMH